MYLSQKKKKKKKKMVSMHLTVSEKTMSMDGWTDGRTTDGRTDGRRRTLIS